jgi:hypothetical protein
MTHDSISHERILSLLRLMALARSATPVVVRIFE